ncbi:MAG: squalene--hopene cyclase, partial [Pirellulales bacterium]
PYSSGAGVENYAAATSMALLAFQGAGHTHFRPGQFKRTVAHGIEALLKMQNKKGSFFDEATGRSSHRFYTHAQATIVVCELYGMTGDENLLEPAVAAVQYLVENQDPGRGGWRYNPRQDSDTSVTGWVVMALQSARMAGLSVPERTFERVMDYLDLVADADESQYAYHTGAAADAPMTAEGLLCRQYLGWPQNDERLVRGANYLLQEKNLPAWKEPDRNVYSWYYATQVMHHMEGDFWQVWNGVMRDLIVENQEVNGREKGSWNPTLPVADRWGHHGGRLFVTCLSIYVLEVYYRHLPIYSNHAGRPKPG